MHRYLWLPALAVILWLSACLGTEQPLSKASPVLRILLDSSDKMVIKPNHNYMITFDGKKEVGRGNIYISATSNGLMINGVLIQENLVEIDPSGFFNYQNGQYRGQCLVILTNSQLYLLNILDMESYLYSVVPSEMPSSWEFEALKAQAVVARTYALYEMVSSKKSRQFFDLYADTRSQVYKGIQSEDKLSSAAVDQTSGEVIKYQDRIIQSFFHACSGGMTETSEAVWGGSPRPYLTSVPSPYGKFRANYKWSASLPLPVLQQHLGLGLPITAVQVINRSPSQRILEVQISDSGSNQVSLSGQKLRGLIGNTAMKSTRANLTIVSNTLMVEGVGYGHGVGMGQWDAQGMAIEGYSYDRIIVYFYKGTRIEKLW